MAQLAEDSATPSRYIVGIDLGTTNSALAYVDTDESPWRVRTFAVPQLVAPGEVEARDTLPSFHYEAGPQELAAGALRLPWTKGDPTTAVGLFARDQGEAAPGRLIHSAKSWLCHNGVDRLAEILPWHAAPDATRLSPVEASSRYLLHMREAWNHAFVRDPLETQDIVLTLPASFDEVARELTVRAARQAGFDRVVLIEEPQAAFYAWLYSQQDRWQELVQPGQTILVCDVGGGTSDFTLIRVRSGAGGKVQFHRVAVGEHLILGGDNVDLALAQHLEERLAPGGKLEANAWSVLVRTCRRVKETLLGPNAPETFTLNLPASGSRLIGGARQVEVSRAELQSLVLEGFVPRVPLEARPEARRSGFQEFGLPYAPDPAITKYLAAFLTAHAQAGEEAGAQSRSKAARPDIVLFNGGFFESTLLRDRLLEVLTSWFSTSEQPWRPQVLANDRLDLAVARGAAYYGMVRRGVGVRIAAGLSRTYYLGVSREGAAPAALSLLPAGIEEGETVHLAEPTLELAIRQPVEFPLFASSTRLTDPPGTLVEIDPEQLTALPPIRTVLETGKKGAGETLPVQLHARLSEIGTVDLWCSELAGKRSWRLQFDVRAATQTHMTAHSGLAERQGFVDQEKIEACQELIARTFAARPNKQQPNKQDQPQQLIKRLESALELPRREWPSSLLRTMWEFLLDAEAGRRISETHEARWLYLLGFALRPGYGLAVDDWRVAQTWRRLNGKRAFHTPAVRAEWWIMWRRIAGGLLLGQQQALAEPLLGALLPTGKSRKSDVTFAAHEQAEIWRLLGSLELLQASVKVDAGNYMLDRLKRDPSLAAPGGWAIGRLGARVPQVGPLNTVVPPKVAERWIEQLVDAPVATDHVALALVQLARRTGDRYRDISQSARDRLLAWLDRQSVPAHYVELVATGGELAADEQTQVFGDSLPTGLRLR